MSFEDPGVEEGPSDPIPGPLGAVGLTGAAWVLMTFGVIALSPEGGGVAGLALGMAFGLGGIGTLAARAIPPPAEARIGLRPMPLRFVPALLLLVPWVLLASEVDNWLADGLRQPGEEFDHVAPTGYALLEVALFSIALRPLLEEFFFRGVLQQGVVAVVGPWRGIALVAALFAFVRAGLALGSAYPFATLACQGLILGLLTGVIRHWTGSLLGGVVLQVASAALTLCLATWPEWLPIVGFNAGEGHTPVGWLVFAGASVAVGLRWLATTAVPETDYAAPAPPSGPVSPP